MFALSATVEAEVEGDESIVVTVTVFVCDAEVVELTVLLVELTEEEVEEEDETEEVDDVLELVLVDDPGIADESVGSAPVAVESGAASRTSMKSRKNGSVAPSLFVIVRVCDPSDMEGDWKKSWLYCAFAACVGVNSTCAPPSTLYSDTGATERRCFALMVP